MESALLLSVFNKIEEFNNAFRNSSEYMYIGGVIFEKTALELSKLGVSIFIVIDLLLKYAKGQE